MKKLPPQMPTELPQPTQLPTAPNPMATDDGNEHLAVVRFYNPETEAHEIKWTYWNSDPSNATQIAYALLGSLVADERRKMQEVVQHAAEHVDNIEQARASDRKKSPLWVPRGRR